MAIVYVCFSPTRGYCGHKHRTAKGARDCVRANVRTCNVSVYPRVVYKVRSCQAHESYLRAAYIASDPKWLRSLQVDLVPIAV